MTEPKLNYLHCPDASGGHRMAYWQWGNPGSGHVVLCVHGLSRQGSHLREMNHGPRFWATVQSVFPEFETARKALRNHAPESLPAF